MFQVTLCVFYQTKPSIRPTGDQLKSMETLAETYSVDLQCSRDVAVAELHLWYIDSWLQLMINQVVL